MSQPDCVTEVGHEVRDGAIVCVVHEAPSDRVRSDALQALVARTPADVPIVVVGLPRDFVAHLPAATTDRLLVHGPAGGSSLADELAQVADAWEAADLVVLAGDTVVPLGWLDRLCAAARSGDIVASASPLTTSAYEDEGDLDARAGAVATVAAPIYPRVEIGGPRCLYMRRSALQLVGMAHGDGLDALIENWCLAVIGAGMVNVVADDLLVGAVVRDASRPATPLVTVLRELDAHDALSPLRRSAALSRSVVRGLTVTMDGRSLTRLGDGTARYTLELALAVRRLTELSLRVLLPPDPAPGVSALLREHEIETISYEQAIAGVERSDIVHRPQQVFSAGDLSLLRLLGDRVIVTHQDLIAYHNPTYHASVQEWKQYRRITRLALAAADRVVFFSEFGRRDAYAEDLVGDDRSDVVGIALDSPFASPEAPHGAREDDEFILCFGSDYRHKNRPFALRLVGELHAQQRWRGRLVFAGPHVEHGSSEAEERALLDQMPALREAVTDLGTVGEAQRAWLLTRARAVIVPSVVEGFGLLPLEAAAAGVPCLFAARSSLREVISERLATLVPWDAAASAVSVTPLLTNDAARRDHVRRLRTDAERWTWKELVGSIVEGYEKAMRSPFRAAAERVWQDLEREQYLADVAAAHADLVAHIGDRAALARDDGFFTTAQQRGLMRVGSRPTVSRALMWPFEVLGRARPRR